MRNDAMEDFDVFQEDYVPENLVGRQEKAENLGELIEVAQHAGATIKIHGPSGSGKTALARNVSQESSLESVYVNCWKNKTRHSVMSEIVEKVDKTFWVKKPGCPTSDVYDHLKSEIDQRVVVVLDEVDRAENLEVLYDLHRVENFVLIPIIADEVSFRQRDKVDSRFRSAAEIKMDRYSSEVLANILERRASDGIPSRFWSSSLLSMIAERSGGDARVALEALMHSYMRAKTRDTREIEEQDVDNVMQSVQETPSGFKLNRHQEILLEVIQEREKVSPGELYAEYRYKADNPRVERTLRNYLNEMERAGLIETAGSGRWRKFLSSEGGVSANGV